jgi:hypothetical protein
VDLGVYGTRHPIAWVKLTEDSATFSRFSRLLGHFDFVAWTYYGLLRN